jgi:putative membrane protein
MIWPDIGPDPSQFERHIRRCHNSLMGKIMSGHNRIVILSIVWACMAPLAVGQAPPASGSTAGEGKAGAVDQNFVKEAVQGDLAEVSMGKLAQQRGKSDAVKMFGQMLEQDHGQHLTKATAMAQQIGVTPPTEPNAKQKAAYDKLSKTPDSAFDTAFATEMVKDHKEDIAKYEAEAKTKGALAGFAQETVPTLQAHLNTAQSLSAKTSSR